MRLVHGLRYGLALVLLGHTPPMLCGAIAGALCGLAGCLCGCVPGCYSLAWCMVVNANDSHIDSFVLHALGLCVSVCGRVCLRGFLCGLVLACLGMVPLYASLYEPSLHALPYPLRLEHENMA